MKRWFPYCATILLFIFVINLLGFLPLPFTGQTWHHIPVFGIYAATSQISVTLALALMTWVFTHVEGIHYNGVIRYFRAWIPDVPKAILPLIVPIEILSQFMRLISLSVRLYANMLAGHMLILTMIGLIFIVHTPPWRLFGLPAGTRHWLGPSMAQPSSSRSCPLNSRPTRPSGIKRAFFQRTFVDAGGGHTLRGGITKPISF